MNEKEGAWQLKIALKVKNFEVAGAEASWHLDAPRVHSIAVSEKEGTWQLKITPQVKNLEVAGAEASWHLAGKKFL